MANKPNIEILGVYQVEYTEELLQEAIRMKYTDLLQYTAEEQKEIQEDLKKELSGIVLIELIVHDTDEDFSLNDFKQPGIGQVAYDEALLSLDGTKILKKYPNQFQLGKEHRIAFFLHYFDPTKPLVTSYGPVNCPPIQKMPERLKSLVPYSPVD